MPQTKASWPHGATIEFTRPQRFVKVVFLHCSASDRKQDDDVKVMRAWHLERGWPDVGYHYFITKQGDIQPGRDIEQIPTAQSGHNTGSTAICLHGLDEKNFTSAQFESLIALCTAINKAYQPTVMRFRGHREVSTKSCPVYDYKKVLGLDSAGHMTGVTSTTPLVASEPPPAGAGATRPGPALEPLARGPAVKVLQNLLVLNGAQLEPDGVFGQQTLAALRSFQRQVGLQADGIAGPRTRKALAHGAPGVRTLKPGMSGNDVKAMQRILSLHRSTLIADGHFGPGTVKALASFQVARGVPASGVFDEPSRAASWEG